MPRIVGVAARTCHGDLHATLAALDTAQGQPGPIDSEFVPTILTIAREACGSTHPDLLLLATTKADLPRWCDSLLAEQPLLDGGPADLARTLGSALGCPGLAIGAACASGPAAMAVAARWLAAGRARHVLVIGADRLAPFEAEGFAALGAIDPLACRPFDAERVGLRLGEAVAAVLLGADDGVDDGHGLHLSGWGGSMDANHLTGPTRDGSGLALACRRALERAGVDTPALVIAHGTGTRYNDDSESLAYAAVCAQTPVTGFKGLIGHSLGACGVLELALATAIHRRHSAPGTVNLRQQGCAGAIRVLTPGQHALGPGAVLGANAGFGGLNGSTVISNRPAPKRARREARLSARVILDAQGWRRERDGEIQLHAWDEAGVDGRLPRLAAKEIIGRIDASWGRMDLACRALVTMGHLLGPLPEHAGAVLATIAGCAATDREFERQRRAGIIDPQRFAYTLATTPLGELSIRSRLRGPGLTVQGADDAQARAVAADLIADGADGALVAWIESDSLPHRAEAELWLPA